MEDRGEEESSVALEERADSFEFCALACDDNAKVVLSDFGVGSVSSLPSQSSWRPTNLGQARWRSSSNSKTHKSQSFEMGVAFLGILLY